MKKWKTIGHIGVDAGLCWVGDPCYIFHKEEKEKKELIGTIGKNWREFCDKINHEKGYTSFNYPAGHEGLGFAISTGYGDGYYPIEIREVNGRVAEIRIKFIED